MCGFWSVTGPGELTDCPIGYSQPFGEDYPCVTDCPSVRGDVPPAFLVRTPRLSRIACAARLPLPCMRRRRCVRPDRSADRALAIRSPGRRCAWPDSFVRAARPARSALPCPTVGGPARRVRVGGLASGTRARPIKGDGGTPGAEVAADGGPVAEGDPGRACEGEEGRPARERSPRRIHRDAMTFYSSGADNRPTAGRGGGAGQVRTRLLGPLEWTQRPGRSYERGLVTAPVARFPARSGNQER